MQPNLSMVLEQVGKDKGIDKKVLVQTLEQAILTAAKKVFGLERELEAQFNEESGQVDLFQVCIVTEQPGVRGRDIAKADADRQGLRAEVGDELLFQIFYADSDVEKADDQGLAFVRERAPFTPMPSDGQIRFADQTVLLRAPFRVTFSYAGRDQVWQPSWRGYMQLPNVIRVTVRDSGTGQVLAVSSAAIVHVNAPAECAQAKNAMDCLDTRLRADAEKKQEQF